MVKARLNVLQQDQIPQIHDMALQILETTGIRVDDEKALALFHKHIPAKGDSNKVCIPREITEWAIKSAPTKIDVQRRDGQEAFCLNSKNRESSIFGVGVTNLHYQDPLTDELTTFQRKHMVESVRLGDALNEFDVISTPGVIQEAHIDPVDAELLSFLEMLGNTDKPIVLLISEPKTFSQCLDMCDEIAGEEATKNSIIPYFNPITPLILNGETTEKMDLCISRGMPFIFSNYGMSGATCPITPGGTLALLVAELLAGLVYSQLSREGTPIILGSLPAAFDMKTMQSYYTPQSILINLAGSEMMNHYGIPHCGTSGGWMGRGPDLIASSMLWSNHLTSIMGRAGLVPFVGNNFDSMAFSPATVVYAAEVIRMSRDFIKGFSLAPDEVGLSDIDALGPGGSFLSAGLTMKKFKEPLSNSKIWPFMNFEKWQDQGSPRAGDDLRSYTRNLLDQFAGPDNYETILDKGESFIRSLG